MRLVVPVSVPNEYIRIAGTVNDAPTVFVADTITPNICICYCEKNLLDTYNVTVNFYGEDDVILFTESKVITQKECTFISDRTDEDVEYANSLSARERAELKEDLKGCVNLSDFERVVNSHKVAAVLNSAQLDELVIPEFPDMQFFTKLTGNVQYITIRGPILGNAPTPPTAPMNTIEKWNSLESIVEGNFNIKTTRFEYFGTQTELPIRRSDIVGTLPIRYLGDTYKLDIKELANIPLEELYSSNIIQAINDIYVAMQSTETET